MASCGYPYYVGGFFDDRNQLLCSATGVVRDSKFFLGAKRITARTLTEALSIDRKSKTVQIKDLTSQNVENLPYDKLILASGARPRMPRVPGSDLAGITTMQSMKDAEIECELVVVAIGVIPNSDLAASACATFFSGDRSFDCDGASDAEQA